jgi:hypothetical protein
LDLEELDVAGCKRSRSRSAATEIAFGNRHQRCTLLQIQSNANALTATLRPVVVALSFALCFFITLGASQPVYI